MTVAMDRFGAYAKKTRYMAQNQASIKAKTKRILEDYKLGHGTSSGSVNSPFLSMHSTY